VSLPDSLIHVTLDGDDIGFGYEADLGIVADADRFLQALGDRLGDEGEEVQSVDEPAGSTAKSTGTARAEAVRSADRERFAALADERGANDPLRSVEVLREVRETLPSEAVVTADAGGFRLWTLVSFPAAGPSRYVNPGSWATMGTGLPSAIGAKLANADRDVVALTGDGGLMMCVHEMHTLAAEDIDVTVVAFTNDDYAIISEEASRSYDLPAGAYGWAETAIDLVAVASGMGVRAERVTDRDAVGEALTSALAHDGPVLIEVATDPDEPQASEWMTRER
jgi:acetolactate synthase-1/2/3 large subunit